MGFLHWVGDHLKRIAHTPQALIDALHRVSTVLWHVLTSLGGVVRTAWGAMLTGARDIGYWTNELAGATYTKLRELFTVTIPNAVRHTLADAWRRAAGAINDLSRWAHTAVTGALHYAQRIVGDLRSWAQDTVRWLTAHVADALSRIRRLERRVFALLDAPEHLVIWIFGALWHYTWRYLRRSQVAIARWLLTNAVHLMLRSAREIEAVIAEIL